MNIVCVLYDFMLLSPELALVQYRAHRIREASSLLNKFFQMYIRFSVRYKSMQHNMPFLSKRILDLKKNSIYTSCF